MKRYKNDIYHTIDLYVSVGEDKEEIAEGFVFYSEQDRKTFMGNGYEAITCCLKDKKGDEAVLVYFRDKDTVNYSNVAHEAFHAADFIMNETGVVFNEGCDNEHVAYLIGWVARNISQYMSS